MTFYNIENTATAGAVMAPAASDGSYWGTLLPVVAILSDTGTSLWVTAAGFVNEYIVTYSVNAITGDVTLEDYYGYRNGVYIESATDVFATYSSAAISAWLGGLVSITAPINHFNDDIRGNDYADLLRGGPGHDLVIGYGGGDIMHGNEGNDTLWGAAGNDYLLGGGGRDELWGGAGRDVLSGGGQRDVFDYDVLGESRGALRDRILDFVHLVDDIDLRTIDAKSGVAGNNAFKFIGTQAFHGIAGELKIVKVNASGTANDRTLVQADVNGDSRVDFQVDLVGLKTLTAADFLL